MNVVGCIGLQLYNYGQAISMCFWTATDRPMSYLEKPLSDRRLGLRTLCLLDTKVNELSLARKEGVRTSTILEDEPSG